MEYINFQCIQNFLTTIDNLKYLRISHLCTHLPLPLYQFDQPLSEGATGFICYTCKHSLKDKSLQ